MKPARRPPSRVEEYVRHRTAILAQWAAADELWDAMTVGERIQATRALDDDWQPRR